MADVPAVATPTPEGGAQPEPKQVVVTPAELKAEPAQETTEPKPEPKFYERKINGKAEKIPAEAIDAAAQALGIDAQELLSASQLKRAAYAQFEEAAKIRQQWEKAQKEDPWGLAKNVKGLTDDQIDELAIQRVVAKMQREEHLSKLTPEQQEFEKRRLDAERRIAEAEAREKELQERTVAQQAHAVRERLEPMIIGAIEKAGLPKTPAAVKAVVAQLEMQHRYGIPLDVAAAVREAQESFIQPTAAVLAKMTPEALAKVLGKDAIDAILRHSIAAGKPPAPPTPTPAVSSAQGQGERSYITPKELAAILAQRG